MKSFFSPNISNTGRLVRGLGALGLLTGAWFGWQASPWLGVALLISGAFVMFEALRGWCALRACGIKTKL
ncbi:MAG: YgaP-like transmembrane domain [Verrucomicrobiota bacterium]